MSRLQEEAQFEWMPGVAFFAFQALWLLGLGSISTLSEVHGMTSANAGD